MSFGLSSICNITQLHVNEILLGISTQSGLSRLYWTKLDLTIFHLPELKQCLERNQ